MTEEFLNAIRNKLGSDSKSKNWKHWVAQLDLQTCENCRKMQGKIYPINRRVSDGPPLHLYCRCRIKSMDTVVCGECSKEGKNGADWWLMNRNILPDYYISIEDLLDAGWYYGKAPAKFAPGKMVFGGIYRNDEGLLPQKEGRVWFEADINYHSGQRTGDRLVWSNDGLVFVTYDHYETFKEVVGE